METSFVFENISTSPVLHYNENASVAAVFGHSGLGLKEVEDEILRFNK